MIHKALRLAREFHRLKQVDLASKLQISTSYLSEIEAGKKPPSIDLLEAYSKVFCIPASTFLLFKEQMTDVGDERRVAKAKKMLEFFEWVVKEEDDEGSEKETATPRKTDQAVRT